MGFHPVVKTSPSNAGAAGWIPDWGELRANMSHGKKKKKKVKQKQYCDKFNKAIKNS